MQEVLFEKFESEKSRESFFTKQRGRWTRTQARIIDILADPLNSLLTNKQIAEACDIAESYIYKLQKDQMFLQEVEKRRKSDETIIRLRARVWKALFYNLEHSPSKIRTALEALGDLKPLQIQNVLQVYENMEPQEVDSRLESVLAMRKREESVAESR